VSASVSPIAPLARPSLDAIRAASARLEGVALRTPLIPLGVETPGVEIWLKLECLQPIGSFKLRGAANALLSADPATLARGVYTASAGNMAQGVAWCARRLGVPCTVVVPDHAPRAKLDAIARLGARTVAVPFERWWRVLVEHRFDDMEGVFVHPVADAAVIAGNGTVGLELIDDLPEVDVVLVPYGGGGLASGIASAVKAVRADARVYGCEVETATPLATSLAAGEARTVAYTASFVDGIGGRSVLGEMWPLVREVLDGARVVALDEVAAAIRTLVERNRVVAEGAGATPVAAALAMAREVREGDARGAPLRVACIVSGGNIDPAKLALILQGGVP
jgi:threonine dehydratase